MNRLALMIVCIGLSVMVHAQQIRIVVLDARHGNPIVYECLNISLGQWHGTDILAATNKDGVVVLSLAENQVSAEIVPGKICNGMASTKPFPITGAPTKISVLPDYYVSCQYSKKLTKDPAWLRASPSERIPSFAVQDILRTGIVATNSCSRIKPMPKPGELVLIVRNGTFLEGMKS